MEQGVGQVPLLNLTLGIGGWSKPHPYKRALVLTRDLL